MMLQPTHLSLDFGHKIGMYLIFKFGFETTWNIMGFILIVVIFLIQFFKKLDKK
jgi:hypothetical protein